MRLCQDTQKHEDKLRTDYVCIVVGPNDIVIRINHNCRQRKYHTFVHYKNENLFFN